MREWDYVWRCVCVCACLSVGVHLCVCSLWTNKPLLKLMQKNPLHPLRPHRRIRGPRAKQVWNQQGESSPNSTVTLRQIKKAITEDSNIFLSHTICYALVLIEDKYGNYISSQDTLLEEEMIPKAWAYSSSFFFFLFSSCSTWLSIKTEIRWSTTLDVTY